MNVSMVSCGVLAAVFCAAAAQASPVDIRVTGEFEPGSCIPTMGNAQGEIDFGAIDPASLNRDVQTVLPTRSMNLSVACSGAATAVIRFSDERAGTVVGGLTVPGVSLTAGSALGLGEVGGVGIGMYVVKITGSVGDGETVYVTSSSINDPSNWQFPASTKLLSTAYYIAYQKSQMVQRPGQYKSIVSTLEVTPVIRPTKELSLSDQIALDGAGTFELVML